MPPAIATHFMGKGGAAAITIMLFMAIVSTGSAEQIAVSSSSPYDIYRKYINTNATGEDILRVSRYGVVAFGVFMGFLSLILDEIGLSLGFVYLMMGIFIGSAVMPISFVLTWDKANANGAVCGAISGQSSVSSPGSPPPPGLDEARSPSTLSARTTPCSPVTSSPSAPPGIIHAAMSFMAPQNFDFSTLNDRIQLIDDKLPAFEDDEDSNPKSSRTRSRGFRSGAWGFTFVMIIVWPASRSRGLRHLRTAAVSSTRATSTSGLPSPSLGYRRHRR